MEDDPSCSASQSSSSHSIYLSDIYILGFMDCGAPGVSSPLITLRASGWRYLFPATQRHIGKVRITAQAGRFGGKIVFCVVCITHKRFPHERLEISTRQCSIGRCTVWSTTTWVHEPSLIWCFYKYPLPSHSMLWS
jgi:hypothetical protein